MFDAQNPIIGNLLREIDVGEKYITSKLLKKAPNIKDVEIQSRLKVLKNRNFHHHHHHLNLSNHHQHIFHCFNLHNHHHFLYFHPHQGCLHHLHHH